MMTRSELLRIMAALAVRRPRRVSWLASGDRAMRVYVAGSERSRRRSQLCYGCDHHDDHRAFSRSASASSHPPPPLGENPLLRPGLALAEANVQHSGESDDGILTAAEAAQLD
jgi:hypothetical protein